MIVFRYTKKDGAEFLSHLDLLRHIDRTMKRAGIEVKRSEAVNKHPKIYLSAPLGVGISSEAEYCSVDTDFEGDFKEAFNAHAPRGIRCVSYRHTESKVNVAYEITANAFLVEGIAPFDPEEILREETLVLTDKRGRTKDVRPSILELARRGESAYMKLKTGEATLRPDVLGEYLVSRYGGEVSSVLKIQSYGLEKYGL